MEKKPTLLVAAAALVDADGLVLLQQRSPERAMAGLWEFPGGKLEDQELPEQALVRELNEELGIEVDPESLVAATFASARLGDRHLLLLLYICRAWRGVPRPLDAEALQWVKPEAMAALPMPPADRPMVEVLRMLL